MPGKARVSSKAKAKSKSKFGKNPPSSKVVSKGKSAKNVLSQKELIKAKLATGSRRGPPPPLSREVPPPLVPSIDGDDILPMAGFGDDFHEDAPAAGKFAFDRAQLLLELSSVTPSLVLDADVPLDSVARKLLEHPSNAFTTVAQLRRIKSIKSVIHSSLLSGAERSDLELLLEFGKNSFEFFTPGLGPKFGQRFNSVSVKELQRHVDDRLPISLRSISDYVLPGAVAYEPNWKTFPKVLRAVGIVTEGGYHEIEDAIFQVNVSSREIALHTIVREATPLLERKLMGDYVLRECRTAGHRFVGKVAPKPPLKAPPKGSAPVVPRGPPFCFKCLKDEPCDKSDPGFFHGPWRNKEAARRSVLR